MLNYLVFTPVHRFRPLIRKADSLKAEPFLLKEEKKREYGVPAPAETVIFQDAAALQETESAKIIEDIPENKEALV